MQFGSSWGLKDNQSSYILTDMKKKTSGKKWILKLAKEDPKSELDFEIRFRLSLTVAQRFKRMFTRSKQIAKMMASHGHQKTPLILQRS